VRHFHLALTADVELRAGLLDDALATVAQALAEATGSCFYEAELHRLRGATLLASSPALVDEAEASFLQAVEVTRAQGALRLVKRAHAGLRSCRRAPPRSPAVGAC
jgi:adenylate cyclase